MDMVNTIPIIDPSMPIDQVDWEAGAFLLIDKPFEWTSFDVVNKVRWQLKRHLGKKKFKVGHAGTLDPRATGLLILACGKATKAIETIVAKEKEYTGTIKLGGTTPTYDGEVPVDETFPIDHITDAMIEAAEAHFTGEQLQYPPMFSAIKKDGKKLYEIARKGKTVEVEPRPIEIKSLKFERTHKDEVHFRCICSKGTYIRSLAHDLGRYLKSGAYLSTLKRTAIGNYSLDDAWELPALVALFDELNQ